MLNNTIFLNGSFYFRSQSFAAGCKFSIILYYTDYFSQLTQRSNGKQVGRYQETKYRRIIRRPERRDNQTNRFYRTTKTIQQSITLLGSCTAKLIRSVIVFTLLLDKRLIYQLHGLHPFIVEYRCITCFFPIMISQADRIT